MESGQPMTDKELVNVTIEAYSNLQRIKACNTCENKELDYQIKVLVAKLAALGVSVEDISL